MDYKASSVRDRSSTFVYECVCRLCLRQVVFLVASCCRRDVGVHFYHCHHQTSDKTVVNEREGLVLLMVSEISLMSQCWGGESSAARSWCPGSRERMQGWGGVGRLVSFLLSCLSLSRAQLICWCAFRILGASEPNEVDNKD